MELCDKNCNSCPFILHPNSRMITKVLNRLLDVYGDGVYGIVQDLCPNLTVCYDCRVDDFCHIEGECEIIDNEKDILLLQRKIKLKNIDK